MQITVEQLSHVYTAKSSSFLTAYVQPLNDTFAKYNISTAQRICAFLAQVGHESAQLGTLEENLNYSAQALRTVFPKYFTTMTQATTYARHPEMIANRVYSCRMGNGDEASGDGWRYHGRGAIQITGHDNYAAFAQDQGISVQDAITMLITPQGACMSAGWFWRANALNSLADVDEFDVITHRINGGLNGSADRHALWERAKQAVK